MTRVHTTSPPWVLWAVLILACAPLEARAQQGITIPEAPDDPAFTAIGLKPTVVGRPTSTASFASSLLSGVSVNGTIIPGTAVSLAPIWVFTGRDVTLRQWREDGVQQVISRTTVSAATAQNPEGDGVLVSAALRSVLVDQGDPRHDKELSDCVYDALGRVDPGMGDTLPTDPLEPTVVNKDLGIQECKDKARERRRERGFFVAISSAPVWGSTDGSVSNLGFERLETWVDLAFGFGGEVGQGEEPADVVLGAALAVRHGYQAETKVHSGDLGVQLRIQHHNTLKGSLSVAWKPGDLSKLDETSESFAAGLDGSVRLHGDYWLTLNATYQGGQDSPVTGVLGTGGLRYAF